MKYGICGRCMRNPAEHPITHELDEPIKGGPIWTEDKGMVEMPDITAYVTYVCTSCKGA